MPLISNMDVTYIEQRRELLNYQSGAPGRRGCTRTVPATPPRHVDVISTLPSKSPCFVSGTQYETKRCSPKT